MAKEKSKLDEDFEDEEVMENDISESSSNDSKSGKKTDDKKSDKKKRESGKKISKFFKDSKSEFKKIIWPTRKTVVRNTSVTIAMCAVVGLAVSLFDWGLSSLIQLFVK